MIGVVVYALVLEALVNTPLREQPRMHLFCLRYALRFESSVSLFVPGHQLARQGWSVELGLRLEYVFARPNALIRRDLIRDVVGEIRDTFRLWASSSTKTPCNHAACEFPFDVGVLRLRSGFALG